MEEYKALTNAQHEIEARVQSIAKLKEAKSPKKGAKAAPDVQTAADDFDEDEAKRAIAELLANDSSDSDQSVYDDDDIEGVSPHGVPHF